MVCDDKLKLVKKMTKTFDKHTIIPHFEQLLGDLTTIDYLLGRIVSHAKLYQATADYQHDSSQAVLFSLFYLLLVRELKAGNTLFWLSDDGVQKNAYNGCTGLENLIAPTWQKTLIAQVWQILLECLEQETCDMLADIALSCANALPSLAHHEMAGVVHACMEQIRQLLGQLHLPSHYIPPVEQLVLLLLRLCYVATKQGLSTADKLHAYLLGTPFFMLMGERQVCPLVLSCVSSHAQGTTKQGFGVWLYRSYLAESKLIAHLKRLQIQTHHALPTFNQDNLNPEQKQAVITALTHHFSIITGGPGTGKTFTVARLVMALLSEKTSPPTLALSAPTGKAAQRMQESLQLAVGNTNITLPQAMTIHRLLGMGMDVVPRYHADNPLPFDVIIVDEASMLGVELSQKLFSAVGTGSRLILLGDNHQLSAVEAGMVLGDLCRLDSLSACHQTLIQSRRFSDTSGVGRLAKLVNADTPSSLGDIHSLIQADEQLSLISSFDGNYQRLITPYESYFALCQKFFNKMPSPDEVGRLFECLNRYRILCASHRGEFGDETINAQVSQAHLASQNRHLSYVPTWYHGRVVMITKNHYDLGLFNGDMGICLKQPQGFVVYFDGKPLPIATALLPDESVVSAYAITIHKSQGSEFDHVAICLDGHSQRLLSKELLYTAITRAKEQVSLYADDEALLFALQNPTIRNTGLELLCQTVDG